MSAKSVLHMKNSHITEIGAGKVCGPTGKIRVNTGNLKIEFEWGPCLLYNQRNHH